MAMKCLAQPVRTYAIRARPDLSIVSATTDPPAIATVTWIHVAFGRGPEFEAILKNDVVPAMKKGGVTEFLVHEAFLGGDVNEWIILAPYKNFADLDGVPPLVRALGPEGAAKLAAKATGIVVSMQRSVMRYRADLSYRAASSQ
jgi:hypothetical protein